MEEGLKKNCYPLFVAEGTHEAKRTQVASNAYLHYCLGKLARVESPIVTFGFSFSDSDRHIENELTENLLMEKIYVGVFGDIEINKNFKFVKRRMESERKKLIKSNNNKKARELEVIFYDSTTACVWD